MQSIEVEEVEVAVAVDYGSGVNRSKNSTAENSDRPHAYSKPILIFITFFHIRNYIC